MNNQQAKGGRFFPVDQPAMAPARYGSFAPTPKIYRVELTKARTREKMGIGGSFLWAYKSSSIGVSVDIAFNTQNSDAMTFYVGTSLGGLKFSELFVTNDAQAGAWIDFFVIDQGEVITSLNPANVFTSVTLTQPSNSSGLLDKVVGAGAAANLVSALATRRELIIQADITNVGPIRIFSNAAGRGVKMYPGDVVTTKNTGVIQAYNENAADCTLNLSYEYD